MSTIPAKASGSPTRPLRALRALPACAAAMLLAACSSAPDPAFSAFESMPGAVWLYQRPAVFHADTAAADSVTHGALLLSLRHTAAYPFRNIWVEVGQSLPPADSAAQAPLAERDTFEIILADPFGKWRGSGMGASLRFTDTLAADYRLHRGATLSLRHIMRTDSLPGIEQAGLILASY